MPRELDLKEILDILPHRYPFLMVDRILDLDLDKRTVVGLKNVTVNEPYFSGHFPGNPIMPGVLIIEAMAQVGGVMALLATPDYRPGMPGTQVFFMGIDKTRFRRPVRPGDSLTIKIETLRGGGKVWKLAGKAYVGQELAAEAELIAALQLPEEGEA